MILTKHFTLAEFTTSQTAMRRGIDNTPTAEALQNLQELANGLERVRAVLGCPILISSGYRSPKLNAAIGGARNSQHCKGEAADFIAPGFGSPMEVCKEIVRHQESIQFDQLIHEGSWVHISFTPEPRGQVLTAVFGEGATRYVKGIV